MGGVFARLRADTELWVWKIAGHARRFFWLRFDPEQDILVKLMCV